MQDRLTSHELELLVWLDLVIRGDERVKQTDIYRAQQERLKLFTDEDAIVAEILELPRRSRHLERILRRVATAHTCAGMRRSFVRCVSVLISISRAFDGWNDSSPSGAAPMRQ